MKIKTKLISALILLAGLSSSAYALEAYGLNTVAGYSSVLRTSQGSAHSDVVFAVKKPDGSVFEVPAKTGANGVAVKELSDYYTRTAGNYGVAIKGDNAFRAFRVFAGSVSDTGSVVNPSDQVVRSTKEKASLKVKLADRYGNPVEGHIVKLIPSSEDTDVRYRTKSVKTDARGEIDFDLSSNEPGRVTYSVYDATEDKVLSSRARVVYFDGRGGSVTGGNLYASVLGSVGNAGAVDEFEFKNLPASVKVGENVSITLAALDASKGPVSNYNGTIRFAVKGDNSSFANLPQDYEFKLEDQGEHTFSLAFSFQNAGTYDLEVRDLDNPDILGTTSIVVVENAGTAGAASANVSGLGIDNPSPGGVYSNNVQVVSGSAPAGSNLRIFDNNIKIGELVVDSSGAFTFTSGLLENGEHKIYVATVNEVGTIINTSPAVDFTIDTSPVALGDVSFDPPGAVNPGEIVKITLQMEDALSKAQLTLNSNVYDLAKNPDGDYSVSIPAPIEFGDYKLSFSLVDELGNDASFDDAAVLKVGKAGPVKNAAPGKVLNLVLTPGDGKVTLKWMPPVEGADNIVHYRIFYGVSPNQLVNGVDTFTNTTTWYIPGLTNGTTYYFGVVAVTDKSAISDGFDKILAATPNPVVVNVVSPIIEQGVGGADALEEMERDASESGPEILWLVLLAAFGGIFYSETTKRKIRIRKVKSEDC